MKIRGKFNVVSIVIVLAMLISIVFAYISFNGISSVMDTFYHVQYVNTKSQMEIRKDIQTINKRILVAFVSNDNDITNQQIADFDERFVKIDNLISDMGKTINAPELIAEMQASFSDLKSETYRLMDLIKSGKSDEALKIYNSTFNDVVSERFVSALSAVGDLSDVQAEEKYEESVSIKRIAIIMLIVIAGISCILCAVLFGRLSREIVGRITKLELAARKMGEGSFDIEIERDDVRKDELAEMTNSFAQMAETTKTVISDVCYVLDGMGNGNFAVSSNCRESYIGEYRRIIESFEEINLKLRDMFENMNRIAAQVEMGSGQIASGSMMLSQGSVEQASTIEQLSATIHSINDQISETSKNADSVNDYSIEVSEKIDAQNEQMHHLLSAMKQIEEKSNEIEKIIKAIDDIAFQTNILALNAAVEAARAGTAGKGFAVVADEVRNLAGKSADAAKETSMLIESAIQAIQNGSEIASEAADSLNEVVGKSRQTTQLIGNIAEMSKHQASAISELTIGLEQISKVVQQNSATAEQSSASCQELNENATSMKQLVESISY